MSFFSKLASKTSDVLSSIGKDHDSKSEKSEKADKSKSSKSDSKSGTSSSSSAASTGTKEKKAKKKKEKPPQELAPGQVAATATYIPSAKGPKSSASGKGHDAVQNVKKTRMGRGLSDIEELQLSKLARIYETLYGSGTVPPQFKTEVKTDHLFKYTQGYTPDEKAIHSNKWYRDISDTNGKFTKEAKEIVNIICNYQSSKVKKIGVHFSGYPDDPEHCFCDEFKEWTVKIFANLTVESAKENIKTRISYLDDILCKEDLFDQPGSGDIHTIQKTFIKVRHSLKNAMHTVDTMTMDVGTSVEEIINLVGNLLDESASLLWYSFREKGMKEDEDEETQPTDKASEIHKSVLSNPVFKVVFANRFKPGSPSIGNLVKYPVVKYNDKGNLVLHEMYLPLPPNTPPPTSFQLVELGNLQYTKIFTGDSSGFDRSFRSNEPVAKLYLEGHALLVEIASVWGVYRQAKKCHQALVQNQLSNAHFRDILKLTENLAAALRSTLHKVVEIGEARFEQLVEINWATVLRCPWIANFRVLPKLFVKVEQCVANLFKALSVAAGKCSVHVKVDKDADEKAELFIAAAEELTKNVGRSVGFTFTALKDLQDQKANSTKLELEPVQIQEEASTADKLFNFLSNPGALIGDKGKEEKTVEEAPKKKGFKQYTIELVTDDKLGAGTDANVYCVLVGSIARTGKIELGEDESNSRFEQGQIDSFTIDVEADIGEVVELILGHDNKGGGSDWMVKEARLADLSTQNEYTFTCNVTIGGAFKKCEASFKPDKN